MERGVLVYEAVGEWGQGVHFGAVRRARDRRRDDFLWTTKSRVHRPGMTNDPVSVGSGSVPKVTTAKPAHPPSTTADSPAADRLIEVRRSARRRRTVSAYRDGDRTIVLLPSRMSKADEREWVAVMVKRLADQDRRRAGKAVRSDAELSARAGELSRRYLDGAAQPASVRWVSNQVSRWGSCTPSDGSIRLSNRLTGMPSWVVDYVLVHELAHLLAEGHGPAFQALVARYPQSERARGYLLGVAATGQHGGADGDGPDLAADADPVDEAVPVPPPAASVARKPELTLESLF
jgi:predicted metal-dependent hydrolase